MTTENVITNSDIRTWKQCRRKFWILNMLKMGTDEATVVPAGPMHIGTALHEALEGYYGHQENPVVTLKEIYDFHERTWDGDPDALVAIRKDRELAGIMLDGYLDWVENEGVDAEIEITGAEETLRVPAGTDGWFIQGKLDVRGVHRHTGFKFYLDHKTVADLNSPLQTLEINEQFPTYGMLDQLTRGDDEHCDGGYINMLKRVKRTTRATPPFYHREQVSYNRHQLSSMWRRINAVIEEIVVARLRLARGEDHRAVVYPSPSGDCRWSCPFVKICHQFDDGSRWEDALAGNYVPIDPLARYSSPSLRERSRMNGTEPKTQENKELDAS